jgi:ABC-type lipoprotein export system ATPase subunit
MTCTDSNSFLTISVKEIKRGDTVLLKDTSYSFPSSGLFFLKGENGSGKSTLLSIISGKDWDFDGKITVNSTEIDKADSDDYSESLVSYMTQDSLLFDDLTAVENVLIPYKEKKPDKAKEILVSLGLEKCLSQKTSSLSKGERQRVAFARMIYAPKKIILLDEITAFLDEESQEVISKTVRELSKTSLVIFVIHDKIPSFYMDEYGIITISGKKIVEQKAYSTEKKKDDLQVGIKKKNKTQDIFQVAKKEKGFHIIVSVFTFLLTIVSILFSGLYSGFEGKTMVDGHEISKYQEKTYENYLSSSPSLLVDTGKSGLSVPFDQGSEFGFISFYSLFNGTTQQGVGNAFCGLAICNDSKFSFIDHEDSSLIKGKFPSAINECIVSSFCFDHLKAVQMRNGLTEKAAENWLFTDFRIESNYSEKMKLVGVYQGRILGDFDKRTQSDVNYLPLSRESYAFMAETVFTFSDDLSSFLVRLLINTENNRRLMKASYVIPEILWSSGDAQLYNIVDSDSNGKYSAYMYFGELTAGNLLLLIISWALLLIIAITIPLAYYSNNRRFFLLLRVMGVSRHKLNSPRFAGFAFNALLSYLLGAGIGIGLFYLTENLFASSVLGSGASYLTFSWLGLFIPMLISGLFIGLIYLVIYRYLSPKDITKKLYQIKEK